MLVPTALRLNLTGHSDDPQEESLRYRAAIEMAGFAEANGFGVVSVEEHHCAENGWLPSPLTMAGAIIGRTNRIAVSTAALLVTLYDPVRLAEEIAILDLISGGRFSFVAGLGYRPTEYAALDKDWASRGARMDHVIETLLAAWSGEPFEYNGETIRVTPVPLTKPHPPFAIGGMSKAAALRAARFGLPFYPPMEMPELTVIYQEELERNGKQGGVFYPTEENSMIFIDEDPERAWQELAPYFLRESQEYASWKREGVPRPGEQAVLDIDDLRAQKRYEIIHPDECIERIRTQGPNFTPCLHPLCGGIPVERAWQGLELYVDKVLGPLREA
ncbi:MAG: LLM class flavin-dependent oxidoreductase [Deltaproteobacteria bacterium]|nr:LLM class flavin-dependent oxidoreductase [Deltaproteobacteria bacterium]